MKIFYFRKNTIVWGIILIAVIIALIIIMRVFNLGAEHSQSTFIIADNCLRQRM